MTHDEALEMSEALRVIREDPHLWEEFANIANGILQDEINKEVIKAIYDATTGFCSCCGAPAINGSQDHDPECMWYENDH